MQSKNDACRMSLTEEALNNLPFWPSLTKQEKETIHRSAFVRHYEKGSFVHSSDNECLEIFPAPVRFVPLKTLANSGFSKSQIEYFFVFSPAFLSKGFLSAFGTTRTAGGNRYGAISKWS